MGQAIQIRRMPIELANKIAAGEVVQRTASAVKELIENAIDATSTEISVSIKASGSNLIQVTDNGIGMSPEDAVQCFERHATSKITRSEDLESSRTLGFRRGLGLNCRDCAGFTKNKTAGRFAGNTCAH